MARSSHPPAWYPDPEHPTRVRRWNGRAWTGDVRPQPGWVRTVRLAPGPVARVRHPSRRLWLVSAGCLLLGVLALLGLGVSPARRAEHIGDRRFAAAADARCAAMVRAVVAPNRRATSGAAEVHRNERLAEASEDLADELRALPLDAADVAAVDRWLAAWDRSTSLRHDYAAALAVGDEAGAARIAQRAAIPTATINAFADANGMPSCIFR